MKVYVAIVEDRHAETEAYVFSTPEKAIEFARKTAKESCFDMSDYEEIETKGWLFHVQYSCESDRVYVTERTLDSEE